MADTLSWVGICGSLRRDSLNRALLRVAGTLLPEGVALAPRDLADIPLYNGDVEAQGLPAPVVALREAIRAADGVLLVTPEYNHGVPGVLKNAVDWVSRGKDQPLAGKPLALISASNGGFGGARAQLHWLPTLAVLGTQWMHKPEFYLSNAGSAFTPEGGLADERTRENLRRLLSAFADWCRARRTLG